MELLLIIFLFLFTGGAVWLGRKLWGAVDRRTPRILCSDGEVRIAEAFAHTRDIVLAGLIRTGSPYDGKLVLTNQRLIYCRYDENAKRLGLVLTPNQLQSVESEDPKGLARLKNILGKNTTLKIAYLPQGKTKPKHVTWTIPEWSATQGVESSVFLPKEAMFQNPHTAHSLADMLRRWQKGEIELPTKGKNEGT